MKEQALTLKYAEQYTENKPYNMKYCKSKNKDRSEERRVGKEC